MFITFPRDWMRYRQDIDWYCASAFHQAMELVSVSEIAHWVLFSAKQVKRKPREIFMQKNVALIWAEAGLCQNWPR